MSLDSISEITPELTEKQLDDVDGGAALAFALIVIATSVALHQWMENHAD